MRWIKFIIRAIMFRSISSAKWVDAYEQYERKEARP
jgi:hypothetical protein